uniref:Uncharacterized protein n=1 Tax=Panagrolaimus sp. JU765 TaxID=591449 RepID=A0AC34RJG3_9BILA
GSVPSFSRSQGSYKTPRNKNVKKILIEAPANPTVDTKEPELTTSVESFVKPEDDIPVAKTEESESVENSDFQADHETLQELNDEKPELVTFEKELKGKEEIADSIVELEGPQIVEVEFRDSGVVSDAISKTEHGKEVYEFKPNMESPRKKKSKGKKKKNKKQFDSMKFYPATKDYIKEPKPNEFSDLSTIVEKADGKQEVDPVEEVEKQKDQVEEIEEQKVPTEEIQDHHVEVDGSQDDFKSVLDVEEDKAESEATFEFEGQDELAVKEIGGFGDHGKNDLESSIGTIEDSSFTESRSVRILNSQTEYEPVSETEEDQENKPMINNGKKKKVKDNKKEKKLECIANAVKTAAGVSNERSSGCIHNVSIESSITYHNFFDYNNEEEDDDLDILPGSDAVACVPVGERPARVIIIMSSNQTVLESDQCVLVASKLDEKHFGYRIISDTNIFSMPNLPDAFDRPLESLYFNDLTVCLASGLTRQDEEAVPFEQEVEQIPPHSPLFPYMPDFDAFFEDDNLGEDVVSEADATAEEPVEPPRQQMPNRSIPRVQAVPNREDLIRQIEALKQDHQRINGLQFNGNIFQYNGETIDDWIGHYEKLVKKMKSYKDRFGDS